MTILFGNDRALATLVPHTTSPRGSRFEVTVGVPFLGAGDTSSISKRVINRLRSVLRSSYWFAVIHSPLRLRAASSLIACLIAAREGSPRLRERYVSRPDQATCVCASIRPGRIVLP
jgi:hypothetical protein